MIRACSTCGARSISPTAIACDYCGRAYPKVDFTAAEQNRVFKRLSRHPHFGALRQLSTITGPYHLTKIEDILERLEEIDRFRFPSSFHQTSQDYNHQWFMFCTRVAEKWAEDIYDTVREDARVLFGETERLLFAMHDFCAKHFMSQKTLRKEYPDGNALWIYNVGEVHDRGYSTSPTLTIIQLLELYTLQIKTLRTTESVKAADQGVRKLVEAWCKMDQHYHQVASEAYSARLSQASFYSRYREPIEAIALSSQKVRGTDFLKGIDLGASSASIDPSTVQSPASELTDNDTGDKNGNAQGATLRAVLGLILFLAALAHAYYKYFP